jgi:hypothetical protein
MTIRLEVFTGSPTDWFNTLDFISSEIDQTDAKLTRRLNAALRAELSQFKEAPPGVAPAIFASLFLRLDTRLSDQEGAR